MMQREGVWYKKKFSEKFYFENLKIHPKRYIRIRLKKNVFAFYLNRLLDSNKQKYRGALEN
jgi:hypothetical protein